MDSNEYTLYSGGHKGAECLFGENAEKWGLNEVNFSYEGHLMAREKNIKNLSQEELQKGDISMEMVFQCMGRHYTEAEKIRRVVQSIYHMIINSAEVFAVGVINPNNTVKGGTGWGVELAKFFNRKVFVYDQNKKDWYYWQKGEWQKTFPKIGAKNFCGTGTRNLTEDGEKAIAQLFNNSFKKN